MSEWSQGGEQEEISGLCSSCRYVDIYSASKVHKEKLPNKLNTNGLYVSIVRTAKSLTPKQNTYGFYKTNERVL